MTNFYSSSKKSHTPTGSAYKTTGIPKHMAQTCRMYSTRAKTPKSKSVEHSTGLNKNKMISSFINGEGFGFNFYLNNDNNNNENCDNGDKNSEQQIKTMSKTTGIFAKKEDKYGEEIDKLLNFYMKEMNDSKLCI